MDDSNGQPIRSGPYYSGDRVVVVEQNCLTLRITSRRKKPLSDNLGDLASGRYFNPAGLTRISDEDIPKMIDYHRKRAKKHKTSLSFLKEYLAKNPVSCADKAEPRTPETGIPKFIGRDEGIPIYEVNIIP